jgi:hypothetical protein
MISYKDRHTRKWKVLFTGTGDRIAIDDMVTQIGRTLQDPSNSQQFIYGCYGFWLLMAGQVGQVKEAKQTLTTSLSAKTTYTDIVGKPGEDDSNTTHLQLLKARSLLSVIDSITD